MDMNSRFTNKFRTRPRRRGKQGALVAATPTRSRSIRIFAGAALLPVAALALAGCASSASGSTAPPTTADGHTATVGVASTGLGKVLVDAQGRTLYMFKNDAGMMKSTCYGACAATWSPLRISGKPTVGSGASASMVATIARSDGKPQVTYGGHPVYLFEGDQKAGDTNGEGLTAFGASWYALSPAGNQVLGGQAMSSGGGYGY
jgi:predicted lipoprotein with Yx(FWY)xxD motif